MKKAIFLMVIMAATFSMMSVSAFAHGGCGHGTGRQTQYAACTVESCAETRRHQHDGTWYCADHESGVCYGGYCRTA